jgi:hypothetical protein
MKIPKRTLLDEIRYYGFYSWYYWLIERPRKLKWFLQRGWQGYADCDLWDFDYYLATIISKGLKQFRAYYHGAEPKKSELDIIIKGFEANLKMMDDQKKYDKLLPTFHKGMDLLKKYFNYLWD